MPQLTMRSGWIRISGVGSAIASARPRTSIPPRVPRIRALKVVDHDRRSARAGDVPELLRLLQLDAADLDRIACRVVDPSNRHHVRGAVRANRRNPSELMAAGEVAKLGVGEHAHHAG